MPTGIEWTDETWNPIRGCSRVSEGCRNCYAEGVAYRFSGPGKPYEGLVRINAAGVRVKEWSGVVRLVEEHLADPLRWAKPKRIFVNSMSDLFHDGVSDLTLLGIFAVMANTHIATGFGETHTFQILTKRPERMLNFMSRLKWRFGLAMVEISGRTYILNWMPYLDGDEWVSLSGRTASPGEERPGHVLPNVLLGVSVENQQAADARLDYLCELAERGWRTMVSFEPLLSSVDPGPRWLSLGEKTWAIVGGESGSSARPMHPDWVRDLRDLCASAKVPFFFKQWGQWSCHLDRDRDDPDWRANYTRLHSSRSIQFLNLAGGSGFHGERLVVMRRVSKKAAGDFLDGKQWHEFPAVKA